MRMGQVLDEQNIPEIGRWIVIPTWFGTLIKRSAAVSTWAMYPGACVERACPFVYAYEAWGRTYMGCMQKVFAVEIDLDTGMPVPARPTPSSVSKSGR